MIIFLGIVLMLLPSYLIRFTILGIPSTALEVLILIFLFWSVARSFMSSKLEPINRHATFQKLKQLGKINYAIGLFVLAGIISTVISPEPLKALGQLKSFIIEPVLI